MAKIAPAYFDNAGACHGSAEQAVTADIAAALGRVGGDAGIAAGVAKLILDKRQEIERAFADFDQMMGGPRHG